MVLEVAVIDVPPGGAQAFADDFPSARAVIAEVPGVLSVRMTKGVETPTRFVLLVEWTDIAAHEDFRASPAFTAWRAVIGPHFAHPPHVEHYTDV